MELGVEQSFWWVNLDDLDINIIINKWVVEEYQLIPEIQCEIAIIKCLSNIYVNFLYCNWNYAKHRWNKHWCWHLNCIFFLVDVASILFCGAFCRLNWFWKMLTKKLCQLISFSSEIFWGATWTLASFWWFAVVAKGRKTIKMIKCQEYGQLNCTRCSWYTWS